MYVPSSQILKLRDMEKNLTNSLNQIHFDLESWGAHFCFDLKILQFVERIFDFYVINENISLMQEIFSVVELSQVQNLAPALEICLFLFN